MAMLDFKKMLFYTEKWEKDNKNIRFVEKFVPIVKNKPITGKFYSKYEALHSIKAPEDYVKLIERHDELLPADIYSYKPPTSNMDYGWFVKPLVPRTSDPRLYFPLKISDVVKTEMRIRDIDKGISRGKFVGIAFKTN